MRARWLGWAGVELEAAGETLVIDPLGDPRALYARLGQRAQGAELPAVVQPFSKRSAVAGLLTHLHRDHADAGALREALAPDAPVLGPPRAGGGERENLGLAQATAELSRAGFAIRRSRGPVARSARSASSPCRPSTARANRKSHGSSKPKADASFISATPSSTASGGA